MKKLMILSIFLLTACGSNKHAGFDSAQSELYFPMIKGNPITISSSGYWEKP